MMSNHKTPTAVIARGKKIRTNVMCDSPLIIYRNEDHMKVISGLFLPLLLFTTYVTSPAADWVKAGVFPSDIAGNAGVQALAGTQRRIYAVVNWKIYCSTDEGSSWSSAGPKDHAISTVKEQDQNLFVATLTGLYRSQDQGHTWMTLPGGNKGEVIHLDGKKIFAGSTSGTLFLSTDLGSTWQYLNPNILWGPITSVINIGDTIIVGTGAATGEPYDGLFLSQNNGRSWTIVSHLNVWCLTMVGINILAGTDNGVYGSTDGGVTWAPRSLQDNKISALTVQDNQIFAGTGTGDAFYSPDNGLSWTGIKSGQQVPAVTTLLVSGRYLLIGTQGRGVYRTSLPYNGFFTMFHIALLLLLVALATTAICFRETLAKFLSRIRQFNQRAPAEDSGSASAGPSLISESVATINKPSKTESSMKPSLTKYSAGVFVLAGLSFLLPFVAASCNGQRVVEVTGIQLVTGTKIDAPSAYGYNERREMNPEPLAILAFIATLAGVVFFFVKGRIGRILSSISGGIGFIFLLLLQSKLNSDAANQGGNLLQVNYLVGFWIALVLLLVGAILNLYLLFRERITIRT